MEVSRDRVVIVFFLFINDGYITVTKSVIGNKHVMIHKMICIL